MRNIRMIIAAAAAVPALALGGGIAYASSSGGTSPGTAPAATVAAVTVQTHAPAPGQARCNSGQPGHYQINCDDRGHSGQQVRQPARPAPRTGTQLTSTQRAGHQGNQGTGQHGGQQGNGSGGNGSGYHRSGSCGWGC